MNIPPRPKEEVIAGLLQNSPGEACQSELFHLTYPVCTLSRGAYKEGEHRPCGVHSQGNMYLNRFMREPRLMESSHQQ
jgi:hypothetical protein